MYDQNLPKFIGNALPVVEDQIMYLLGIEFFEVQ